MTCCPSFRPRKTNVAHQAEPSQPTTWIIYKLAAKRVWIGEIEAADKREAVEKAAKEFRQHASKLIAVSK
jgi:hypothetical protein